MRGQGTLRQRVEIGDMSTVMATPHILTGAAIGRALHRRQWLAVSLSFASHFALDATPHLDSNDLYGSSAGFTMPEVAIGVADIAVGCVIVVILTRARHWRVVALWSAFSAIALDLVNTVPPWGEWFAAWPGTAWLDRLHHGIQPNVPPESVLLGFGTQAAVTGMALWLLCRADGVSPPAEDQSDHDEPQAPRPRSDR